jgi:hypothetical protein
MKAPKGLFPAYGSQIRQFKATGEYRYPKQGEYFLSGAIPAAYPAFQDVSSKYWIARIARLKTCPRCNGTGKVEA